MKLQLILEEVQDKTTADELSAEMGAALKKLGSEFEKNKEEAKDEVEQTDMQVNEALGTAAIIGMLLAAPKVVEIFVNAFVSLTRGFKKLIGRGQGKESESKVAAAIIKFTHKWHKAYIKAIKYILKWTGIFKKAGITDDAGQDKAASVVYYTIIAGFAVYSGIGAVKAFKTALSTPELAYAAKEFSIAGLEAAMATIKSGEIAEFIAKIGLK